MTPKDTVEALNNHLDNPDAVRTAAEQGAQDQNRAKDTVEGWRERFQEQFVEMSTFYARDMHNRPPLYDTKTEDVEAIKSFIQTELDLTLTKEQARVNEVLEGMKNPDYNERNERNATLSDAQKRITDV